MWGSRWAMKEWGMQGGSALSISLIHDKRGDWGTEHRMRRKEMKKALSLISFLAAMAFCMEGFAQEQKLTEISFEADTIEGDLMAPNSSNIAIKEIDELSSLIRAREDFVDEMRKTVDEL